MAKSDKQKDAELDLIIDEVESVVRNPEPKTKTEKPKKEFTNVNKEEYHRAKAHHKKAIKRLRGEKRGLIAEWFAKSKSIKKHKMLKKQAKITYKLSKMKEK